MRVESFLTDLFIPSYADFQGCPRLYKIQPESK